MNPFRWSRYALSALLLAAICCLPLQAQLTIAPMPSTVSVPIGVFATPLNAQGGTGVYTNWSVISGSLPPGVRIVTDSIPSWLPGGTTAALAGVATTPGVYPFTLQVTDSAAATATWAMQVTIFTMRVTSNSSLPDGAVGAPYSFHITTAGVTSPVFSPQAGNPAWLNVAADGTLSGTPTDPGGYSISVSVSDGANTIGAGFQIWIGAAGFTTPATLPPATVGTVYSQTLSTTGATGTYVTCCPPAGLNLAADGTLSGTPQQSGTWNWGVQLNDAGGNMLARRQFFLEVASVPPNLPSVWTPWPNDVTVGQQTMIQLSPSGGQPPLTWSFSGLPDGMTGLVDPIGTLLPPYQNPGNAYLSGSPGAAGTSMVSAIVTDSSSPALSGASNYELVATPLAVDIALPWGTLGQPYTGRIGVLGGTPPYHWAILAGGLPYGLTLDASTGLVSGTVQDDSGLSFYLEATDSASNRLRQQSWVPVNGSGLSICCGNAWEIQPNQSFSMTFSGYGGSGSYNWSVVAGSLPPGVTLPGGATATLSGTPTADGEFVFVLRMEDSADSSKASQRQITITVTPLSLGPALPYGNAGSAYNQQITVQGATGTVTVTLSPTSALLPAGLTLASDGTLSGTPTQSGNFNIDVLIHDAGTGTTIERQVSIPLFPAGVTPPVFIQNNPYLGTFETSPLLLGLQAIGGNGTYVWSVTGGSLPPGVSLRSDTPLGWGPPTSAALAGVPKVPGTYNFTLTVTSGTVSDSLAFTITITGIPPIECCWELPDGIAGVAYTHQFVTNALTGTLHWSVEPGTTLPAGLSLSDSGVLSGMPSVTSLVSFVVTNGTGTLHRSTWFYVDAGGITTDGALPQAVQFTTYDQLHPLARLAAVGGGNSFQWSAPGLPAGMLLDTDGTLWGTPQQAGTWDLWVTATDSVTHLFWQKRMDLNVVGTPPVLMGINWSNPIDTFTLGSWQSWEISVTGGSAPYTWALQGTPPPGLMLRFGATAVPWAAPLNASLWGQPSQTGTFNFIVSVTDSTGQTVGRAFQVTTVAMDWQSNMPWGTYNQPYQGQIYPYGETPGYTLTILDGKLAAGLSLNPTTGAITGTPIETGWVWARVRATDSAGHSMIRSFSINIGSPDTTITQSGPDLSAITGQPFWTTLWASGAASYQWAALSPLPFGFTLDPNTGVLSGTVPADATPGPYTFMVRAADALNPSNYGDRQYVLTVTPIQITATPYNYAIEGQPFSITFTATGGSGPITWSWDPSSMPPPGLQLGADGTVSGTPTAAGQTGGCVIATDTAGNKQSYCFGLSIWGPGGPPLQVTSTGTYGIMPGPFMFQLQASGGTPPYHFSTVPGTEIAGVRVQDGPPQPDWYPVPSASLVGVIVPPAGATTTTVYSTRILVTDSLGQTAQGVMSLTVSPVVVTSQYTLPRAINGVAYAHPFTAVGGVAPYLWTLNQGNTLPPGLSLVGGAISGTATVPGYYYFSLTATDTNGNTAGAGFGLEVDAVGITTDPMLPQAQVGTPYNVPLVATGGTPPYTWQGCCWPAGINLNPATGVLSGTPTSNNFNPFSITVRDSTGLTSTRTFLLAVVAPPAPLTINTPANLGQWGIGSQFYQLNVSGGVPPYTWTPEPGSNLPPLLSLASPGQNLVDWGTPGATYLTGAVTQPGTYSFTLRVTDSTGAWATRAFSLTVSPIYVATTNLPFQHQTLSYNVPYSQGLLAMGGTGTYTWTALTPPPAGLSVTGAGVVAGTPQTTGNGSFTVQATDGGGATYQRAINTFVSSGTPATLWFNSGPDLGSVTTYDNLSVPLNPNGSPLGTPNYVVTLARGSMPAGLIFTGTILTGTPQSIGTFNFTLEVRDASGNLGAAAYTLRVSPISITTAASLPDASMVLPYSQTLTEVGGISPVWSVAPGSSLPDGMTLSAGGVLSGTPTVSGDYSFTLMVTDSRGMPATRTFSLHITAMAITSPGLLPTAVVNTPYSYTLTAAGGGASKTWSLQGTVSGMTLSRAGVITANFPYYGSTSFYAQVTDGTNTVSKFFVIPVAQDHPPILSIDSTVAHLADTTVGVSYQAQLTVDGGVPPYNWSVLSGSTLPPGLVLQSGATLPGNQTPGTSWLSGTPTVPNQYQFVLQVSDGAGAILRRTFLLNVSSLSLAQSASVMQFHIPTTVTLTAAGGAPPYTFSLAGGALPAGMTMSSSGVISGTPVSTPNGFQVQVRDNLGATLTQGVSQQVQPSPSQGPWTMGNWNWLWASSSMGMTGQIGFWGGTPPFTFAVEPGSVPASMSLTADPGGWSASFNSLYTPVGQFTFLARVTDSVGNFQVSQVDGSAAQLHIPRFYPPEGRVGLPYNWQIRAFGANPPFTYSVQPGFFLPPGMSLSPTGLLSSPSLLESSRFSISIRVTDAAGHWQNWGGTLVALPASQASPLISLDPGTDDGSVGVLYRFSFDNLQRSDSLGGVPPFTWTVEPGSTLPPGLVLVPGSGITGTYLTGVPTAAGVYNYTMRQTDSIGQSILRKFTTHISAIWLSSSLPRATVGVPYSYVAAPSGGTPPYTYSIATFSGLPAGIAPSSNGSLSGTPTVAGAYFLSVTVKDSAGETFSPRWMVLYVDAPGNAYPETVLTPDSLDIQWYQGDPAPAPAAINVSNGPTANLPFTANVIGIPGATLSVTSGTTPRSTSLKFDPAALAGLSPGDYWGIAVVTSPQSADELDQYVPVKLTVAVPPPCTYAVSPPSGTLTSDGGSGSLNVTTAGRCSWTATSSQPWLTLQAPANGSGNGTVNYSAASNPNSTQRNANITVGDQTYTVTQFGSACSYALDRYSVSPDASGGSVTVAVQVSAGGCTWGATSDNPDWITVGPPADGTVQVTVAANPGTGARTGTAHIAGQVFTVTQGGVACVVSLASSGDSMPASGGSDSVGVTLPPACGYSTANPPSWISVTSGGSGTGPSGTVNFSVAANSSITPRTGSLVIGGQPFQISQAGVTCSFNVTSGDTVLGSSAATGLVTVTAAATACDWTASSNAGWLGITNGATGLGNGSVSFSATANSGTVARTGTLTVAGQTVTVNQAGITCSYSLRSSSASTPAVGGSGSAGVIAPAACTWSAITNDPSWLSISATGSAGSSSVDFVVGMNTSTTPRSGTLTVAGQTYTVTQEGRPCTFSLAAPYTTVAPGGASSSIGFSTGDSACVAPVAQSFSSWIGASSTFNSGTGAGTLSFTVAQNTTSRPRSGTIQVGDQTFTVNQTAAPCAFNLNAAGAVFGQAGGEGYLLASASMLGCTPIVGVSGPEITLQDLTGPTLNIWRQNFLVSPYTSLDGWVRWMEVNVSGTNFVVKQTAW